MTLQKNRGYKRVVVSFYLFMSQKIANKIALTCLLFVSGAKLANAREINSYEDFKLYCSDTAYQYDVASPYCDDYRPYYKDRIEQEPDRLHNIDAEDSRIKRRDTDRNDVSGYAGFSLGVFFPENEDADTGFGESLFVGGRWNRYFATDIEITNFIGGGELFDPDYYAWALTINPRLIIPFNDNYNSATIYISPGIGVSLVSDLEDTTTTDLAWQIKGGFTIPIKDKFNIFLQGRYISQFSEEDNSAFSTEIGFSVNFQ